MGISRRCTSGRRGGRWRRAGRRCWRRLLPDPGTEEGRRELRERIGGRLTETAGKDRADCGTRRSGGSCIGGGRRRRTGGRNSRRFGTRFGRLFPGGRRGCSIRSPGAGDPAGGDAARVRGDGFRPQPGGVVRPAVHPPLPAAGGPGAAGRCRSSRFADPEFRAAMEKAGASPKGGPSLFASGAGQAGGGVRVAPAGVGAAGCWRGRAGAWRRGIRPTRSSSRCGGRAGGRPSRAEGAVRAAGRRGGSNRMRTDGVSVEGAERGLRRALPGGGGGKPRWVEKPTVAYLWARTGRPAATAGWRFRC